MKSPPKNRHAVALGRLGGEKGGPARAKALSARRRREIATRAGLARAGSLTAAERKELARRAALARLVAALTGEVWWPGAARNLLTFVMRSRRRRSIGDRRQLTARYLVGRA